MDTMFQMSKTEIDELNPADDEMQNKGSQAIVAYPTARIDGLSVFYREGCISQSATKKLQGE